MSELFLVTLIKILVLGQESFSGQFLTLHCRIGLDGLGRDQPQGTDSTSPKKPKSFPFPSQHSGQVCEHSLCMHSG